MPSIQGKVALVTGASAGIGKATVESLLARGAIVYGAARRVEKMKGLEDQGAKAIAMDVTSDESMSKGVQMILEQDGSIDILVNNAGYGSYGAIEDVPLSEARRQFEVNIFGLARLIQLVLPTMREEGFGKIVNISSMGGKIYTPLGGWYHATKHALEGFSDCLRIETKPFGIDVIIIEPGGIQSEWGAIAAGNVTEVSGKGAYGESAERVAKTMRDTYDSGKASPASLIADVIAKAVTARRPKTRYAAGYMAKPVLFLRRIVSDRLFDRMIATMS